MGAPRWRQKPDSNQQDIIDALEKIGCVVYDATRVGGGFPDLVVGRSGLCCLLEVKTDSGQLNTKQRRFHEMWTGCTFVVRSPMQAIETVQQYVKDHTIR